MKAKYFRLGIIFALLLLAGARCARAEEAEAPEGGIEMTIQVSSVAFTEGGGIPKRHSCDGEDLSPALAWTGVPNGTQSLALIVDDPDAPGGVFVHWVIYELPADLAGLPEGVARIGTVSGLGVQGTNGFRKTGYNGPCPPKGSSHRYFFKLYALDAALNLKEGISKADLEKAMQGHVLAWGQGMGRYER